jgi:uncharacterized protein YbjQ (UPF0145 family)
MTDQKHTFRLPWVHTPEEIAARAAIEQRRLEVERRAAADRVAEQRRQSADLITLAHGGLPTQAVERLKEIGKDDADSILFTSDLSPEEAGLLRREGYKSRGLVTGSCMYHVGQAYASSQSSCEISVLSSAYDKATELAVHRMRQELRLIGAHGVVGVRMEVKRHEWADSTVEVQLIGTAVEGPGVAPANPWMCDLSGQEWWALHRAGYIPTGLVWGHAAWFVLTTYADEWIDNSYANQEHADWSQALSMARHIAMANIRRLATEGHATGVAGVKISRRLDGVRLSGPGEDPAYEREHHNLVISIIGTAIRLMPSAPLTVRPTVEVLSLRDGRITPVVLKTVDAKIE